MRVLQCQRTLKSSIVYVCSRLWLAILAQGLANDFGWSQHLAQRDGASRCNPNPQFVFGLMGTAGELGARPGRDDVTHRFSRSILGVSYGIDRQRCEWKVRHANVGAAPLALAKPGVSYVAHTTTSQKLLTAKPLQHAARERSRGWFPLGPAGAPLHPVAHFADKCYDSADACRRSGRG